jgi:hypothetical protein
VGKAIMLKAFLCAIALLTLAMARSVNAQEPATSPSIQVPGTECDIVGLSFDARPIVRNKLCLRRSKLGFRSNSIFRSSVRTPV